MEVVKLLPRPKRALFIGRWQPFHDGHEIIIREALAKGPVAIGVRQTDIDMDNPMPVQCRITQIQETLEGEDVVVFAVPDIASIHIGRDVGYEVHRDVRGISGSEERRKARGDMDPGREG
jgi:nicotinamide mononucleotide adenylyltransferase